MKKINIERIIKRTGIRKKELAAQLFPMNKYPSMSLNRVINGEAFLDSEQISKLSHITGLSIDDLFTGDDWKTSYDAKNDTVVFRNGEYTAVLSRTDWSTKLYHNNSMFHEVILTSNKINLTDYFKVLDDIIAKYKKQ